MPMTRQIRTTNRQEQRRTLLMSIAAILLLTGCAIGSSRTTRELTPEEQRMKEKFRGIYGLVLRFDAATEKRYVSITTDREIQINRSGGLGPNGATQSTYTDNSMPIPLRVRAIWRVGDFSTVVRGKHGWEGGTIAGGYTVPVAERIPDEVLDEIRQRGGALRLKVRLADDGILIGWDIEKSLPIRNLPAGYKGIKEYIEYVMPGGDFREAQRYDGKIVEKGWYIDRKTGQKIETDY